VKRATCTRCAHAYPVLTVVTAIDADLQIVREQILLCANCRARAHHESAHGTQQATGVVGVALLEELWALPVVEEPPAPYICPQCKNYWDTPVHYYSCERRNWP